MARRVTLPDCPPSIVIRRSDGACLSPEWTREELHSKMQRLVDLYGEKIIAGAMAAAQEVQHA